MQGASAKSLHEVWSNDGQGLWTGPVWGGHKGQETVTCSPPALLVCRHTDPLKGWFTGLTKVSLE